MPASVIGISMNLGYPGSQARNDPGTMTVARPVKTATPVKFGVPAKLNPDNTHDAMIATDLFAVFAGITLRNVKQATVYASNASGQYEKNEACDVMTKGYVTVSVNPTASLTAGGTVFAVFTTATGEFAYYDSVSGGTGFTSVALTNAKWTTGIVDANYVAELALLTPNVG